jgi:chemotaxis protein MotB
VATGRYARPRYQGADYWPGFVDALATLLLVIVFLLSVFMVAQFYLRSALTGRDEALIRLEDQIAELSTLLALERQTTEDIRGELTAMTATLSIMTSRADDAEAEVSRLGGIIAGQEGGVNAAAARTSDLEGQLAEERELSAEAAAQLALANQQMAALRLQIASLQEALEASEARDDANNAVIADLGRRLNAALAARVQELARYRSEFFGRLREVLADRDDIEIVGDRFVFQSEILFDSGSADLSPVGQIELQRFAGALSEVSATIPNDIDWVLRVDGHTDVRPINTAEFPSNWHLSAARAIAVLEFLTSRGIPPQRLVAAGFGEFQPLDANSTDAAYRRNRRIEFKLTER